MSLGMLRALSDAARQGSHLEASEVQDVGSSFLPSSLFLNKRLKQKAQNKRKTRFCGCLLKTNK